MRIRISKYDTNKLERDNNNKIEGSEILGLFQRKINGLFGKNVNLVRLLLIEENQNSVEYKAVLEL